MWGGCWGWLLHRNPEVYTYIAASRRRFPDSRELLRKLACAGFDVLASRPFFLGVVRMVICRRAR
jgi:ubiquinone/menaquinone biosynthesis C-methylase UbiE